MSEHTFGPGDGLSDDIATILAAELAERILEEISRARHNWRAIYAMAAALSLLAARMSRPSDRPPRIPPSP